ncbi:tyrosine-type recombinase/integrase [Vibrio sp.]|uniref:tyrosine-type recombinase/integrase n=1 Tax=Vibrio sp. TaxID=678 RepID=UPI003D0DA665
MAKYNRCGQAEIFTSADYAKLFKVVKNPNHKLMLTVLKYTGERIGAVCQLRLVDVYSDVERQLPAPYVFFRAETRKRSPSGEQESLTVPMHPNLAALLSVIQPKDRVWLFPSKHRPGKPVSPKSADKWYRLALERAGLKPKGYSLHSTRRTFITMLSRSGVPLPVIRKITGHKSLETLKRYVEVDPEECRHAIESLPF